MEIWELKKGLQTLGMSCSQGYEDYSLENLLTSAQQGDNNAKLQILTKFRGLIYNALTRNDYYLQLNECDALQMVSEVMLQEIAVWQPAEAIAFGNHIRYCLRTAIWSEIRRVRKHDFKERSYDDADGGEVSSAKLQLDALIYRNFEHKDKRATQRFAVEDLLAGLTAKQRYVLEAEWFEDKDGVEIARLLRIKKAAVSRIRSRAIERLKELLLQQQEGEAVVLC